MKVQDLAIKDLLLLTPQVYADERGFFLESYNKKTLAQCGIDLDFVQDNVSFSVKGTIRGLHFQSYPGQDKLVRALSGAIWDVAVDIRPDSPTFLHYESVILDSKEHKQLLIPKGFAHGFCVLSDAALVQYKVSHFYDAEKEVSIRWNDPEINIKWPITNPILSPKDQKAPFFKEVQNALDRR